MHEFETILPRRVIPQPTPALYPGGDCGACVLGGALAMSVAQVYGDLADGGKVDAFSWWDMRQALYNARAQGLIDRLIDDVPVWPVRAGAMLYGAPSWQMNLQWFAYLTMAMDAGYYGAACVCSDKGGPLRGQEDHWVLLCGTRARRVSVGDCAARIDNEVLVSCSSRATPDEEWVGELDFLRRRGGFNMLLFRPAR